MHLGTSLFSRQYYAQAYFLVLSLLNRYAFADSRFHVVRVRSVSYRSGYTVQCKLAQKSQPRCYLRFVFACSSSTGRGPAPTCDVCIDRRLVPADRYRASWTLSTRRDR